MDFFFLRSYIGHDNDDRSKMIRFFSFDGSLVNLKGNVVEVPLHLAPPPTLSLLPISDPLCPGANCAASQHRREETPATLLLLR